MTTRIVAAAVRHPTTGRVFSVDAPGRHHDCTRKVVAAGLSFHECDQGFITSDGDYVNRWAALRIAMDADQLIRKTQPTDRLFSEDVW